jgi:hypothetical protein
MFALGGQKSCSGDAGSSEWSGSRSASHDRESLIWPRAALPPSCLTLLPLLAHLPDLARPPRPPLVPPLPLPRPTPLCKTTPVGCIEAASTSNAGCDELAPCAPISFLTYFRFSRVGAPSPAMAAALGLVTTSSGSSLPSLPRVNVLPERVVEGVGEAICCPLRTTVTPT